MRKIQITLIRHTNGQFSVGRDLGTGHGSKVLPGREEADAYARQLQAQLGGPDKATIVVHDLRKATAADKPAA